MSLTQELENLHNTLRTKIPEPVLAKLDQAADELAASGIAERAIKVGDKAPDFQLPNAVGATVQLSELLNNGPVVVSFYRGSW